MIRKTTLSVSALALMLGLGGVPALAQTDGTTTELPPAAGTDSTTTEEAPAAEAVTEDAPAAEAATTTEDAPAAEAAATTEEEPAAETEATTGEAPAAEAEATTEQEPAAETEATTEEEPAAETDATTEETPEAGIQETTEDATEAEAEATTEAEAEAPAEEAPVGDPEAIDQSPEAVVEGVATASGEEAEAEHRENETADGHGGDEEEHGGDHDTGHTEDVDFAFEGPFGAFDQNQLQRGLQIYTEVCSACHGLRYVSIRTLGDPGGPELPEDQVRAYASQNFEVFDEELDDFRPAIPRDHFPPSNLTNAPDLSLMAKARAGFHGPYGLGINQLVQGMGGPEYIYSILTGYTGETREQAGTTFYENTAFPGGWIAMAPPLVGEDIEFADGHSNSLHHEAEDVAAFLMWAAEPKLMARKTVGFVGVIFLAILAVLLYLTNKRLWYPHKHRNRTGE
ncbi:cytochrome c1 [Pseudooceanicola sp.]|uniref:cytochrome c1 n=1 Tax=Pseudooceanicola sp. TaxID=1914328 RepID=UPI0040599C92